MESQQIQHAMLIIFQSITRAPRNNTLPSPPRPQIKLLNNGPRFGIGGAAFFFSEVSEHFTADRLCRSPRDTNSRCCCCCREDVHFTATLHNALRPPAYEVRENNVHFTRTINEGGVEGVRPSLKSNQPTARPTDRMVQKQIE